MNASILLPPTVVLDDEHDLAALPDQTLFPGEMRILELRTLDEIREAIQKLRVRGAPAIGIAAAIGLYLFAKAHPAPDFAAFYAGLQGAAQDLAAARPTAVNLRWALDELLQVARDNQALPVERVVDALRLRVLDMQMDCIEECHAIGEHGLTLLRPGDGVLTHCNAGHFATLHYGTATAPLYLAQERGYDLCVYADETRPLLQGARITCMELQMAGVHVTLLCDNMAASLMAEGKVQAVLVGCDRMAANGDFANKIGTHGVAILAKHFGIPFYVCLPTSSIDMGAATGADIPVEHRSAAEVTDMWYKSPMAPQGVAVYNPAFDVTPAALVTAVVTEKGIARAPYDQSLAAWFFAPGV